MKILKDFTAEDLYKKYGKCKDFPTDLFCEFARSFEWCECIDEDELEDFLDNNTKEKEYNLVVDTLSKDGFISTQTLKIGDIFQLDVTYYMIGAEEDVAGSYQLIDLNSGMTSEAYGSIEELLEDEGIYFHQISENILTFSDFQLRKKKGKK